jgi:hypothetical protein
LLPGQPQALNSAKHIGILAFNVQPTYIVPIIICIFAKKEAPQAMVELKRLLAYIVPIKLILIFFASPVTGAEATVNVLAFTNQLLSISTPSQDSLKSKEPSLGIQGNDVEISENDGIVVKISGGSEGDSLILNERTAIDFFGLNRVNKIVLWELNPQLNSYDEVYIDTALWLNHLNYQQQKSFETFTFLGNIGSPSNPDHYFSRNRNYSFLFNRYYDGYLLASKNYRIYKTIKPFTIVSFSNAGSRKEAEEMLTAFHTQNANKYLNFGVEYRFTGTKGVYENQKTRNSSFAFFGNYCRKNIFLRSTFTYNTFKNNENGGVINYSSLADTIPSLVSVFMRESSKSYSETRNIGFFTTVGYSVFNLKRAEEDLDGKLSEKYVPLITVFLHYNYERNSRVYMNNAPSSNFFNNFYINPNKTRDSARLSVNELLAELEFAQFLKYTGMPGIKFFSGIERMSIYQFNPSDFIIERDDDVYTNYHIGATAFSTSPYLSYRGLVRYYFSGNRDNDKEILGELKISPWKEAGMPQVIGSLMITDSEPNVFIESYFSNHFQWENSFSKQRRILLSGKIKVEKFKTEAGYNVEYINNYLFFNENAIPEQQTEVAVTSFWAQNSIRLGGLNVLNKFIWQANTSGDELSLPRFMLFSAIFYEAIIVKNALTGQFGVNAFLRSKFYADAYSPATGQFYNQREVLIGGYPVVDIFANFKWKRTFIFLKYEHVNQGIPNFDYFSAHHYPINPRVFKFGVSWMFYD